MSKLLRILLIIIGALVILGYIGMRVMKKQTKKYSPTDTVTLVKDDLELEVKYCRPYKKGRDVFGELVPYGEVWRTGANEATTFRTSEDIVFGNTPVPAGIYTLWSIPGEREWQVILNGKRYGWGVTWGGEASRISEHDVAMVGAPVKVPEAPVEQFTISFTQAPLAMVLSWDDMLVEVPIQR